MSVLARLFGGEDSKGSGLFPFQPAPAVHLLNTNVFRAPGGLERFVLESTRFAKNTLGIPSIHLAPHARQTGKFEVVYNLGPSEEVLLDELRALFAHDDFVLQSLHVHHSMNWDKAVFFEVCETLVKRTPLSQLYVHDEHFVTQFSDDSQFHEMSLACFGKFCRVVCPSETAKDLFSKSYPSVRSKVCVIPHMLYEFLEDEDHGDTQKPCLIFSGACGVNKGIERYAELMRDFPTALNWVTVGIEDRFADFPKVKHRHYNFHEGGDLELILREFRPAVAYLASIVPETFSYSVHEMMSAGIPVLCTAESGNIAAVVKKSGCGKVFETFSDLKSYLRQDGIRSLVRQAKRFRVRLNTQGLEKLYLCPENNER